MQCSNCGGLVRPVVAIDIDGTLGDYHDHFIDFAAEYIGAERGMIKRAKRYEGGVEGSFFVHVANCFDLSRRDWEDIKLAYRQGAQKRSMPVFAGASDLAGSCRDAGAEVWVTTTRPYLRLDGIDPDTRFWLKRHGIEYDGLLYDEDKYRRLAERIDPDRVVAVIDDLPEQFVEANKAFGDGTAILRGTKWNTAVGLVPRAGDLNMAAQEIMRRIEAWLA